MLPEYKTIDFETWPRREHFQYYTEKLKVNYSMTARLDVTRLRGECNRKQYHFYSAFVWCASNVVNQMECTRMMRDEEGHPGIWETIHPNYTIFHPENHTFSDCWTCYDPEFEKFYDAMRKDIADAEKVRGIKAKEGQPMNFFCISCIPWLDYTGYATTTSGDRVALFPIITFGKYEKRDGSYTLPLTLTIAHAAMDGWHTSEFFRRMQEELNQVCLPEK